MNRRRGLGRLAVRLRGIPVEDWDSQYASGRWRREERAEWPRYLFIAAIIGAQTSRDSVLDLGCGTAPIREFLRPYGVRSYTGVDLSPAAIAQAQVRASEGDVLIAGDIRSWQAPSRYDAILFSEILCYLESPIGVVKRFTPHLEPDGVMVISNYLPWSLRRIPLRLRLRTMERAISSEFAVHERTLVRNERARLAWRVTVVQPATPSQATKNRRR